jgi:hypothetical protein
MLNITDEYIETFKKMTDEEKVVFTLLRRILPTYMKDDNIGLITQRVVETTRKFDIVEKSFIFRADPYNDPIHIHATSTDRAIENLLSTIRSSYCMFMVEELDNE